MLMSVVATGLAYGTFVLNAVLLGGLLVYGVQRFFGVRLEDITVFRRSVTVLHRYHREAAFGLAAVATAGSLYFSSILGWTPCRLCWYQRILMYPLVVVLGVGLLFDKPDVRDYALPLAMIGLPVSIYHYIVQMTSVHSSGCSVTGVSCGTQYLFSLNYISVPFMAGTAFLSIILLLWLFGEGNEVL
jgi:disulfide bond formation protein DsbB